MTEPAADPGPDRIPAPARLAVVTGADSGIGKATAELLATEGFDVSITYNTDEAGATDTAAAVRERGQRCFVAQQDLATPEAPGVVDALVEQARRTRRPGQQRRDRPPHPRAAAGLLHLAAGPRH